MTSKNNSKGASRLEFNEKKKKINEEHFRIITSTHVRLKIRFDALVSKSNLGLLSFDANVGDVHGCLAKINFLLL